MAVLDVILHKIYDIHPNGIFNKYTSTGALNQFSIFKWRWFGGSGGVVVVDSGHGDGFFDQFFEVRFIEIRQKAAEFVRFRRI